MGTNRYLRPVASLAMLREGPGTAGRSFFQLHSRTIFDIGSVILTTRPQGPLGGNYRPHSTEHRTKYSRGPVCSRVYLVSVVLRGRSYVRRTGRTELASVLGN